MSDSWDSNNGPVSFANPNYHLDPTDINCNPKDDESLQNLYEELDAICKVGGTTSIKSRRSYAQLDINSMGMNIDDVPIENQTTLYLDSQNNMQTVDNRVYSEDSTSPNDSNMQTALGRKNNGFMNYYINLEESSKQRLHAAKEAASASEPVKKPKSYPETPEREKKDFSETLVSKSDEDEEIPHIQGKLTNDLYAVPVKKSPEGKNLRNSLSLEEGQSKSAKQSPSTEKDVFSETLPAGWERHEDEDGPYYWHISSGTIQRDPPQPGTPKQKTENKRWSSDIEALTPLLANLAIQKPTEPDTSKWELKRRSYPEGSPAFNEKNKPIRFAVRSLGWVEINEEDLTPDRSSKAVNKCIVDLSTGKNDLLDVVGRWGDGKDLFMDLDEQSLKLVNPQDLTILNSQPIHTIRVWGVGCDNGRDFAYVARDRMTRKHMCHVFRCDMPARMIANTLRDICKKIMIERGLQQQPPPVATSRVKLVEPSTSGRGPTATRPTNLPTERRYLQPGQETASQLFPTPMEEPKKVLKAFYLGSCSVTKAVGVEVLNAAIEDLSRTLPREQYKKVSVHVAPSTITIFEQKDDTKPIAECRVRFLSFLGIGQDVKNCGFIMHTAQDQYVAHIFYCEPSSGALCKTIEAACKLRYQKCLDAHRKILGNTDDLQTKSLSSTIKNMLGGLTLKLAKGSDS